ncbi:hypothetical protein ACODUO_02890 [Stenotrophomonas maltophilia]
MAKYVERAVDAVQWNQPGDHPDVVSMPEFAQQSGMRPAPGTLFDPGAHVLVTGEGYAFLAPGDWIVTDWEGRTSLVNEEAFAERFQAVELGTSGAPDS